MCHMTQDEIRRELATVRRAREKMDGREHAAIIAAWRAHLRPSEIAALVGRSPAHVRKLRPDDVPPARLGGNAKRESTTRP